MEPLEMTCEITQPRGGRILCQGPGGIPLPSTASSRARLVLVAFAPSWSAQQTLRRLVGRFARKSHGDADELSVQLGVQTAMFEKFPMRAALDDSAVFHHKN